MIKNWTHRQVRAKLDLSPEQRYESSPAWTPPPLEVSQQGISAFPKTSLSTHPITVLSGHNTTRSQRPSKAPSRAYPEPGYNMYRVARAEPPNRLTALPPRSSPNYIHVVLVALVTAFMLPQEPPLTWLR